MKASTMKNDKPKRGSRGYRYPDEIITVVVARVTGGESVSAVSKETGIGDSTIQRWLRAQRKSKVDPEPPNQPNLESAGTDIQIPDSPIAEHHQIDALGDAGVHLLSPNNPAQWMARNLRIEAECSGTRTNAQLVLDDAMVARHLAKRIGRPAEDMQLVPAKTGSQA